jgi:hypothetical protein
MPAYTILFMRQDVTDKRPFRLHISSWLFWLLIISAVGAPVLGFVVSVGWIAPSMLKLNFHNMEEAVQKAEQTLQPLQQQNAALAERKATLEEQVQQMRTKLAEAETRATMAETARIEASTRLAQLESESVNLKQSLAKYESMLKPKISREMVQCNDLEVRMDGQKVKYNTTFSRVGKQTVPDTLSVQVRALAGDNMALLDSSRNSGATVVKELKMSRDTKLSGDLALATVPPGSLRMLDVKVLDGATTVGYCWKTF